MSEEQSRRDQLLSAGLTWVAATTLGYATLQLVVRSLAILSPLTPEAGSKHAGKIVLWLLMAAGGFGLVVRKNWARKLLLVLIGLQALGYARLGLALLGGASQFDALGTVLFLMFTAAFPTALWLLWSGSHLTPGDPVPPGELGKVVRDRAGAVALMLALIMGPNLIQASFHEQLEDLPQEAEGELAALDRPARWIGARLRVTGLQGERVLTEETGPWRLETVPQSGGIVELKGLRFAQRLHVRIDLERNALLINGAVFPGHVVEGKSPMFGDAHFKGVTFERGWGRISGRASILVLNEREIVLDFDKLELDGVRCREYGSLTLVGPTDVAPVHSADPRKSK